MTEDPSRGRRAAFDRFLVLAALAAGGMITLRAPGFGDYPTDAGPGLAAIGHGSLGGFFSHQPAMGALSVYLRAPFVILATALHDSALGTYRLGDLPCVLSVALVAAWMARVAGRRGTSRTGQLLIVTICLVNPLINDALYWGHPEELLTASLAVGSLLAACERRVVLTAILTGLAVASKQWAVLIVCPALLGLERERIRAGLVMLAVAAGSTVPMVIGNLAAFRYTLHYISSPQPVTTPFTWLYPFSPKGIVHISSLFGGKTMFTGRTVPAVVSMISRPLIIGLGVVLPAFVWLRRGRRLSGQAMLLSAALLFVLRCALDPGTVAYYYFPLLLTLIALDVEAGRKLPVAGLSGAAGAFVVLDRFAYYFSEGTANLVYILATAVTVALLVRELRGGERAPGRGWAGRISKQAA